MQTRKLKARFRSGLSALLLAGLACVGGCLFSGPQAGGGGGIEAVGIMGMARYPDGRAAVNARVTLRERDYLPADVGPRPKAGVDTRTDSKGKFKIDSLAYGDYRLEITIDSSFGMTMEASFTPFLEKIDLKTVSLQPLGALNGSLALGSKPVEDAYVGIYGLERSVRTNSQGRFTFKGVPPGQFAIGAHYRYATGRAVESKFQDIALGAGVDTVQLNTLTFNSLCESYACDSLVIRGILDANGRKKVAVDDVALTNSTQRISELRMEGLGLTVISPEIADLGGLEYLYLDRNAVKALPIEMTSMHSLRYLSLAGNVQDTVPSTVLGMKSLEWLVLTGNRLKAVPTALGGLAYLKYLSLDKNEITTLPAEISNLKVLRQLSLDSNQLAALPEGLMALRDLKNMGVAGNRLCTLPQAQTAWLDTVSLDRGWRARQICP